MVALTDILIDQTAKDAAILEVQHALDTCANAGFICTTQGNIDTFTYIVGGLGILIGILACLGFQYSYRKMQEKQAGEESEQKGS